MIKFHIIFQENDINLLLTTATVLNTRSRYFNTKNNTVWFLHFNSKSLVFNLKLGVGNKSKCYAKSGISISGDPNLRSKTFIALLMFLTEFIDLFFISVAIGQRIGIIFSKKISYSGL